MRKATIFFLLISHYATGQDVNGTWRGKITMDQYWKTIAGEGEKHITLNIADNVVTGVVTGWDKCTVPGSEGTCTIQGSGAGELWRVSLNMDGTYDIECTSPKYYCGGGEGEVYTVTVSSQPILNRNLLSGTHTSQGTTEGVGTGSSTITWHLSRVNGLELIVTPRLYDDWMPEPGKDEMTRGKIMTIDLKIISSSGQAPSMKAVAFELELKNTSHEPGITINTPEKPITDWPDIGFITPLNIHAGGQMQELRIDCNKCLTASAQLAAFDGGAFTTLTVKAILEDNSELEGMLNISGGIHEIPIPKRPPGSNIATKWLNTYNHPADDQDDEKSQGNPNNGDGLSAYEEYRGVISEGGFRRLNPQKKEIGVWMKRTDYPLFKEGIGVLESAADLSVIRFFDNEIAADRKLNRNFSTSHIYDQYVQKLVNAPCPKGAIGQNEPIDVRDKIPKLSERTVVDVAQIKRYHAYSRLQRRTLPYTEAEDIAVTVAHELGHGIHISHHGMATPRLDLRIIYRQPRVTIINVRGDTIKTRPYKLTGLSGEPENDASGNCSCIMIYNNVYSWAMTGPRGKVLCKGVPDIALGKILCTDGTGTDINALPYYFANSVGVFANCQNKMKLR